MLDNKKIQSIKRRVKKAAQSLSVMGDLMLAMEIEHSYSLDELMQLKQAGIEYKALDSKIERMRGAK